MSSTENEVEFLSSTSFSVENDCPARVSSCAAAGNTVRFPRVASKNLFVGADSCDGGRNLQSP